MSTNAERSTLQGIRWNANRQSKRPAAVTIYTPERKCRRSIADCDGAALRNRTMMAPLEHMGVVAIHLIVHEQHRPEARCVPQPENPPIVATEALALRRAQGIIRRSLIPWGQVVYDIVRTNRIRGRAQPAVYGC